MPVVARANGDVQADEPQVSRRLLLSGERTMGKGKAVLFAGIVLVAAMLPGMVSGVRQQDVGELKSELQSLKEKLNTLDKRMGSQHEVRARRFTVIDSEGRTRAAFGMGEDQPVFVVVDEQGSPCCLVGTYDGKLECCCVKKK